MSGTPLSQRGRAVLALLAIALLGPAAAAGPPPTTTQVGFAHYEQNKWLFRACLGSGGKARLADVGLPIVDATPAGAVLAAVQQRGQQSIDARRGVYVEFSGYVENGRVSATELQRALGWVASCGERPANVAVDARVWASGNEPSWSMTVDGSGATLRTPDRTLRIPGDALQSAGTVVSWDGVHAGQRLRIELTLVACQDTMAEASFGRTAVMAYGGALYRGCGLLR
jgi:uncharacterized membrane protein